MLIFVSVERIDDMSKRIKFDPNNFNKHTKEGKKLLEESVREVGVIESIATDVNGEIVSGNARKETFDKLGFKPKFIELKSNEYPVIQTNLTGRQRVKAAILANTVALRNINLDEVAIEETGINLEEVGIEEIRSGVVEDLDFNNETPDDPITAIGDVYEIGEHRLICGDSTNDKDIKRLLNKEKADMVLTDPPYEIDIGYSNITSYTEDCHVFIFNNDRALVRQLKTSPLEFKKFFVFHHSGCAIPQEGGNEAFLSHILISHEVYGSPPVRFNIGDGTRTVIKGEYRRSAHHDHEKPLAVLEPLINGYSNKGMIILDLFLGSGATMLASHQLNRLCYGAELDPRYCDVIIKRMLNFDKSLIVKRNGINETDEWIKIIKNEQASE